MIDVELTGLDHKALFDIANWHDKQATILRERAHLLAARANQQNDIDRRLKFLDRLPDTVMRYLRQGCSLIEAMDKAAEHSKVPLATVQTRWQAFIVTKDKKSISRRNKLIMDLAALDLTNAQIGARVDLHPVSVSRIIGQEKRRLISWRRSEYHGLEIVTASSSVPSLQSQAQA